MPSAWNQDGITSRLRRPNTDAEPHDQDRHERGLRQRVEGSHQRVHRRIRQAQAADDEAEQYTLATGVRKKAAGPSKRQSSWNLIGVFCAWAVLTQLARPAAASAAEIFRKVRFSWGSGA